MKGIVAVCQYGMYVTSGGSTVSENGSIMENVKAWPMVEAHRILKKFERMQKSQKGKDTVVFETGYGPSGRPHIGTFGEVVRTSMVRHAFKKISDIPTKLYCFSDDMDGLRKVPKGIQNGEILEKYIDYPLTSVPDPEGLHSSFGDANNAKLCQFLDDFGFEYTFLSATHAYKSGFFDDILQRILEKYDAILEVVLPTLGQVNQSRKTTYSPFLPVCPKTGKILQGGILECHPSRGTIVFADEDGETIELPVSGGNCKLQWKVDWAMRWVALGVDYEMYGKDLIPSAELSSKICSVIGGSSPEFYNYELFLDAEGQKISKSKGNGLSVEEWLECATVESLALFMYQKPKTGKRLHWDVIPKTVDEYYRHLAQYETQSPEERLENPVWYIHMGNPPKSTMIMNFIMLLNLASASGAESGDVLWKFIRRYHPEASPDTHPDLQKSVDYAIGYCHTRVIPHRKYRKPTEVEACALEELKEALLAILADRDAVLDAMPEIIQSLIYDISKKHAFSSTKQWFRALYEVLLGQSDGPRFGSFVYGYGINSTVELIEAALEGKLSH